MDKKKIPKKATDNQPTDQRMTITFHMKITNRLWTDFYCTGIPMFPKTSASIVIRGTSKDSENALI